MTHHFVKSHGLGNDYLVVDPAALPAPIRLTPATVRLICDRHHGVGGDGILEPRPTADTLQEGFGLRIWNPDGSIAEKSGNGLRIFAKWLFEHGRTRVTTFVVATEGGPAPVTLAVDPAVKRVTGVTVDMGVASVSPPSTLSVAGMNLDITTVNVGNPHCVVVVSDLDAADFHRLGPLIERHPAFPDRTNVQFVQVFDDRRIRALIWERGAGETLASGSSSCAIAAACRARGLVGRAVSIQMPGGDLAVCVDDHDHLHLTGPAEEVCRGVFSSDLLARLIALTGQEFSG